MKIEPTGTSSPSVTRTSAQTPKPASSPASASSDAVSLSADLRFADVALRAAAMAGDVRPEAVAHAIELMNNRELGNDMERLADRIIDSLLESRDDQT
jgi:hypothetical protein